MRTCCQFFPMKNRLVKNSNLTLAFIILSQIGTPVEAGPYRISGAEKLTPLTVKVKPHLSRIGKTASGYGTTVAKIAYALLETPYKAGTLEISDKVEIGTLNLATFDCVTFVETTLALAKLFTARASVGLDLSTCTAEQVAEQVMFIRYRSGQVGDYSTRLHYTSDWLFDNVQKGVITLLPNLPGSEPFVKKVNFMSRHPQLYKQLSDAALVAEIEKCEVAINQRPPLTYIPLNKIAMAEPHLRSGDIIAVTTGIDGLDVVHMGFVYRTEDGVAHFLDASSKKSAMQVTLEATPFSKSFQWSKDLTGIIVARPKITTD